MTATTLTYDEIDAIFDELGDADFSNRDDTIDKRDIVSRINDLEAAFKEAELDIKTLDKRQPTTWPESTPHAAWDAWDELKELRQIELYQVDGPFIRETYFTEYAQEVTSDVAGEIPGWVVVNWEATAEGMKMDYTSFEFGDITYYAR